MVGFRRSELLTDGKNNADSVEESDDEKILTDDAYGFSRQSPTIATTAPPSRHSRMGCKSHSQKTGVLTDELLVGAADFFQHGWICFGSGTGPRG